MRHDEVMTGRARNQYSDRLLSDFLEETAVSSCRHAGVGAKAARKMIRRGEATVGSDDVDWILTTDEHSLSAFESLR